MTYLSKCTRLTAILSFFFVSHTATSSTVTSALAAGVASATVSWETPNQRENGEYLNSNEIGGFELAYRLTSEPVYSSVVVAQATATHYELTNLADGEYEFKIAAFDADGLYSDFSESTIALINSSNTGAGGEGGSGAGSDSGSGSGSSDGSGTNTGLVDAVVSWQLPSERENGEGLALADIGGYEIAYRSTDLDVFESVLIDNGALTEYQLTNLAAGEYEFTIAAFDNEGLYSDFSDPTIVMLGAGSGGGSNSGNGTDGSQTGGSESEGTTGDTAGGSNTNENGTGTGSETAGNEGTNQGGLYSATVNWQTPSERENGGFLSPVEIGGYEIAYRLTQSDVFQSIIVEGSLQTQQIINDLIAGEYEFSIAAFDSEGLYSDFSEPTYAVIGAGSNGSENTGSGSGSNDAASGSTDSETGGSNGSGAGANLLAATIRWQVPSERENGQLLSLNELGGYEIAYRNTNDPVFEAIIVTNREQTAYELSNLVAGEYEFSIAAFDNEGLYSDFSEPTIVVLGGGSASASTGGSGDDVADSGSESGSTGSGSAGSGSDTGTGTEGGSENNGDTNSNGQLLSATINWLIPTQRENGELLSSSEIGGFEVAYRNTQTGIYTSLIVDDATQASIEITNLAAGEYEFIIAAFDSEGLYSDFSDPTIATIGTDGSVASSTPTTEGNNTDVADSGTGATGESGSENSGSQSGSTGADGTGQGGSALMVATISWDIPTQRENGQDLMLSEIGGYEILYRPTLSEVYESIVVEDQTQTEIVLNNLPSGEYEFVIAAFDNDGLYSDFSDPTIAMIGH